MIYIILDSKGDDYGAKTEFQRNVLDYFKANTILATINNIKQRLKEFPKLEEQLEFETFNNKGEYDMFMRGLESVSMLGGDDYICYYNDSDAVLSPNIIANCLLSDMSAYQDKVTNIIAIFLEDNPDSKSYWDAWFRGANGKDLENAEKGIIYKK